MKLPIRLVAGQPRSIPIQCYLNGGVTEAVFNSDDILTSGIRQSKQASDLFSPSVDFYTANNSQDGFSQGQVEPSIAIDQAVLLVSGISYTLLVWRALALDPSNPELIVRIPLVIEPISA